MNDGDAKYVVTLRLDEASSSLLNALRERYFPPERNFLPAHLTLFHALTNEHCIQLEHRLPALKWQPLALEFLHPVLIGRGVAIPVARSDLEKRHAFMTDLLGAHELTRQDRQPLRPHVTVQNKVTPAIAKASLAQIAADFAAWRGLGLGVEMWLYAGGPWIPRGYLPFG